MRPTLHLDGRALDDNPERLWRLLLDHTQCERAAARLMADLRAAQRAGPIEYCVITPAAAPVADGARAWRLSVAHLHTAPAAAPEALEHAP